MWMPGGSPQPPILGVPEVEGREVVYGWINRLGVCYGGLVLWCGSICKIGLVGVSGEGEGGPEVGMGKVGSGGAGGTVKSDASL